MTIVGVAKRRDKEEILANMTYGDRDWSINNLMSLSQLTTNSFHFFGASATKIMSRDEYCPMAHRKLSIGARLIQFLLEVTDNISFVEQIKQIAQNSELGSYFVYRDPTSTRRLIRPYQTVQQSSEGIQVRWQGKESLVQIPEACFDVISSQSSISRPKSTSRSFRASFG